MAIYHLTARAISRRSKTRPEGACSVVASAAYRSGEALYDEARQRNWDYRRKSGVLASEILAPNGTPEWLKDRQQLWNAVETVERRKDACLARELEVSLPRELTQTQRRALVRDFVQRTLSREGCIVDIAWHMPRSQRDGGDNPHAHILYSTRRITPEGFGPKNRALEAGRKTLLMAWRKTWEETVNRHLAEAGSDARIDHRSLAAQGIDRLPEPKIGTGAWALEGQGVATQRVARWRTTCHHNGCLVRQPLDLVALAILGVAPWTPKQALILEGQGA